MKASWLTPKATLSTSLKTGGRCIIAVEAIEPGERITAWEGILLKRNDLNSVPQERRRNSLQIGRDLYLVPLILSPGDFVNHSCEPNAGLSGDRTLVALRQIRPQEEITYDYAMSDSSDYDEFRCECGSSRCRQNISGKDWTRPELRQRYRGYFSSYLEEIIQEELETTVENRKTA